MSTKCRFGWSNLLIWGAQMNKRVLFLEPYSLIHSEKATKTEWAVDNLFALSSCSLLSGKPKTGKSTLVRHLIRSVINGEEFLGRKTMKGAVIYLALEEQRNFVKKVFTDVGLMPTDSLLLHLGSILPKMEQIADEISEACELIFPKLVIIDPLIKAISINDTNDYGQSTRATQIFQDIARRHNTHVLLVHHSRKGENAGRDSALGSIGFTGGVDNVLMLENNSTQSTLAIQGRYIEAQQISFIRSGMSLKQITSENHSELLIDKLIGLFDSNSELSRDQIKTRLKRRDEDITAVLNLASERGVIVFSGKGTKGSKKTYKLNSPLENESGSQIGVVL